MPKVVDSIEKKLIIAQTALDIFCQKGFYNTNMQDIAKACEMGRSTLYDYFKNKEEIFIFCLEEFFEAIDTQVINAKCDDSASAMTKIRTLLKAITDSYINAGDKIFVLLDIWAVPEKRKSNYVLTSLLYKVEHFQKLLSEYLQEGIDNKEFKPTNVKSMSTTMLALMDSLLLSLYFLKEEVDYEQYLQDIDILLSGLKQT